MIFEWPLRVYIEDTDAGGIVYYVNYLKFIERARTEFLRSLGYGRDVIFNQDMMFVVYSVQGDYLKPARLDDELVVTVEVESVGRANLVLRQNVFRQSADGVLIDSENNAQELLFRGAVKLACVHRETVKPQRMPAPMLAAIADYQL